MKIKLLLISSFFVLCTQAYTTDELLAKTSIALGDAYLEKAKALENDVVKVLKNQEIDFTNSLSLNNRIVEDYLNFRDLALEEYRNVYCSGVECPEGVGNLNLGKDFLFYKREAYSKAELLLSGAANLGRISNVADVYATNLDFKEHLINRLNGLISQQRKYDELARSLNKNVIDLKTAYINEDLNVVGVDQSVIREENYLLSEQSQYQEYLSCVNSYEAQDQFETEEYKKAIEQYNLLVKNIDSNFDKIYDYKYSNSAGTETFSVKANLGWQDTGIEFAQGEKVRINASGSWANRSATSFFKADHIYESVNGNIDVMFFKSVGKFLKNAVRKVVGTFTGLLGDTLPEQQKLLLQNIEVSDNHIVDRINTGTLKSGPDGYSFSFSNSASKGVSNSTGKGVSAGFGTGFFSVGGSASQGSSESLNSSAGVGGTYGFKLSTSIVPNIPLGTLIGSYCSEVPNGSNCEVFEVGADGVFEIDNYIEGGKLWLRSNDSDLALALNNGELNVEISKATKFSNYLDQYYSWMDQECDDFGENCGLSNILENIAYIPNPYSLASDLFEKKFPEYPSEVKQILLAEIGYLIELNIIKRDIKLKEHGHELTDVKVTHCKEQAKYTEEKVNNTRELIATYSRMNKSRQSMSLLLDASRRFYEQELEGLNWVRSKNLERLDRYYILVVNAFNYLYFSDYRSIGSKANYFEGDYYHENMERMQDQILDITAENDLLNPNRGFVVYDLSYDEMQELISLNPKERKTQLRIRLEDVMCSGFGLNDQTRVMIEKVGILLDLDPAREHLFFKNPYVRSTKSLLVHGSENQFYDLDGRETDYWMPAQQRRINAWSSRILTDVNSDYTELRNSRFFERQSFRKTSFATTWRMDLTDPMLQMYTEGDSEPILQGVKLVFWFNSTELLKSEPVNYCASAPDTLELVSYDDVNQTADIKWSISKDSVAFDNIESFQIYTSKNNNNGYRISDIHSLDNCTDMGEYFECQKTIDTEGYTGLESVNFKIRSSYRKEGQLLDYPGFYSKSLKLTL
ncbi:hypothetical protein [Halobacteriovorax sp. RZ-2]|uniref:hypothetical protein n=1 Tax=unclassified Halobacteriovorax TaxID=2639665 RepID=UPI0037177A6C